MPNKIFSSKNRLKSFSHAFRGIMLMIKQEHNARIHLIAVILVIFMGIIFHITPGEWIAIIIAIGSVLAAEAINSAIENLSNVVYKDEHEGIKSAKDLAAGAVLICSIMALSIGLIVFIPKLLALF